VKLQEGSPSNARKEDIEAVSIWLSPAAAKRGGKEKREREEKGEGVIILPPHDWPNNLPGSRRPNKGFISKERKGKNVPSTRLSILPTLVRSSEKEGEGKKKGKRKRHTREELLSNLVGSTLICQR